MEGNKTATCSVNVNTIAVTGVTLNNTTLTLNIDQTSTLVATVLPDNASNKNVTWSSNNNTIATVDSTGRVTARAAGNAVITVRTEDGNRTATCSITVRPTAVTGVSLDRTNLTLDGGDTTTLIATITPANASNQNVTWSSSNNAVATVNSTGRVTAVSRGTATITVRTADGNRTATCVVNVRDLYVLTNTSYIKNGVTTNLANIGTGSARSMCIVGNDVFVVGTYSSSSTQSAIWKNGVRTETFENSQIRDIVALGNDIFAVGSRLGSHSSNYIATYWEINTAGTSLGWSNLETGTFASDAYSVTASQNKLYIAGAHNTATTRDAILWEVGLGQGQGTTSFTLSKVANTNATASAVFVSGTNVYVAGHNDELGVLWTNGERRPISSNHFAEINSVFRATNGDIYIAGREYQGIQFSEGKVWKVVGSNVSTYQTLVDPDNAHSVVVAGTDVYVGARNGLYKNGIRLGYVSARKVIVVE
jgi:hypothetical protein